MTELIERQKYQYNKTIQKHQRKKVNENMERIERWSEEEHVLEGGKWVGVTQARESNL